MARSTAPPRRQSEITRVAARLFDENGFAGTSMEDIADALGIRKPTLYHYVQSRAQVVSWIHQECVDAVQPALRSYIEQDLPPQQILFLAARDILCLLRDKPGYLRVYFENHRDLDPAEQERIVKARDEYFSMIKLALIRGHEHGVFHVEDPGIAAFAFFGMCNWSYQWFNTSGRITVEELAQRFWSIFVNGVGIRVESEQLELPAPVPQ